MPLLLLSSRSDGDGLWPTVLDHLERAWPGTYVLASGPQAPKGWEGRSGLDWLGAPEGWGDDDRLWAELLATAVERYGAQAAVGLGPGVAGLLARLDGLALRALALPAGSAEERAPSGLQVIGPADGSELLDALDETLVAALPPELAAGPERGWAELAEDLDRHAAAGRMTRLVLRWSGPVDRDLEDILVRLCSADAVGSAPVELELASSELLAVPRSGLTLEPGDVLLSPQAWRQVAALGRLVARAPGQVSIHIRTLSRRGWIQTSVGWSNAALSALGVLRRAVGGRS